VALPKGSKSARVGHNISQSLTSAPLGHLKGREMRCWAKSERRCIQLYVNAQIHPLVRWHDLISVASQIEYFRLGRFVNQQINIEVGHISCEYEVRNDELTLNFEAKAGAKRFNVAVATEISAARVNSNGTPSLSANKHRSRLTSASCNRS